MKQIRPKRPLKRTRPKRPLKPARPKRPLKQTKQRVEPGATLLYYAPGAGLGQLTRGLAILRRWKAHTRRSALLVTYSTFAPLASRQGVAIKQIPGPEPEFLERAVRRAKPKLLVVDTFPRGIVGEIAELIPSLPCPAVLIQRYLNPSYLRQFKVAAFLGQHYRLAVRIADALELQTLSQRTVDVPPVTVREAREVPPARSRSGWLFVNWGEGSEPYLEVAQEAARQRSKELRILGPAESYPAVGWMPRAELVIAAGGYSLFHEVALTATPAIFVPCRRMYDDQFGRTVNATNARTPEALRTLLQGEPPAPLPPHTGEGAAAAVAVLQALLAGMESQRKGSR